MLQPATPPPMITAWAWVFMYNPLLGVQSAKLICLRQEADHSLPFDPSTLRHAQGRHAQGRPALRLAQGRLRTFGSMVRSFLYIVFSASGPKKQYTRSKIRGVLKSKSSIVWATLNS